uniref:C2H2-type domain-containing protein n=1 Tax=Romanomermis culicivorax TaxID=13658 RepID=A0A915KWQ3_ROMCU
INPVKTISLTTENRCQTKAAKIQLPETSQTNEKVKNTTSNNTTGGINLNELEFAFLDNKNVCCGLCGEIVPYETLFSEHLPDAHCNVLSPNFKEWLRSLSKEGLHAQCGLCQAIISLNKKFEIVHLVRHFNCWHPVTHPCSGSWQKLDEESDEEKDSETTTNKKSDDKKAPSSTSEKRKIKPLTMRDFAVIDLADNGLETLQCIWCGMFVETLGLAQHFAEIHYGEVETPKCNLCVQEMVINARF